MKKSKLKKAVGAIVFSAAMLISAGHVSYAKQEWVRDVYPDMYDYVLKKDKDGHYVQIWRDSRNWFTERCVKVEYGKCMIET